MNRRIVRELDPSSWPAFDTSALRSPQRAIYFARHQAIELYVASASLTTIEASTGVKRGHLYRLLDQCLAPHEDGRIFGWRALVPYARVAPYQRIAEVRLRPNGSGAAGAFDELMQRHPLIAEWLARQVRAKRVTIEQTSTTNGLRVRLRGLNHLHIDFLRQCRDAGLTAADYPFSAQRMGIRSLSKVVRAECLGSFARGARLAGATHLKGMPGDVAAPSARQAEAAIATYNASPHHGLNGRTPLEAMEYSVRRSGAMLNWLPEAKRRTLCLMQTPRRVTVRGYLHQGQRPHVNFFGVRYTNAMLASTAAFLGQELSIYYHSQDLRALRAFGADGSEIGVLKAQGAWGEIAHDLKLRQEILRLRGRKRLTGAFSQEFLQEYVQHKLAKAKRTRRAASDLAQTLRTLAAAPTSISELPPQPAPRPAPIQVPGVDAPSPPRQRVVAERLNIGTGFVVSI